MSILKYEPDATATKPRAAFLRKGQNVGTI
ncbi:hypothetical protein SAMN05216525_15821 [Bradyrhizobium sp. Gha]|nr:hypothetical protein SAMN05216525_15821 [Bradyrhizobium sp. Gha]